MAKLGFNGRLYRCTDVSRATWGDLGADLYSHESLVADLPTLVEIEAVRDLAMNVEIDKADATTRGSRGWKISVPTLSDAGVDFEMVYDATDADLIALLLAKFTGASIALAVLDGDADVGTQGLWADFHVMKLDKKEDLAGVQMVSVSVMPAPSTVNPEWVKVIAP